MKSDSLIYLDNNATTQPLPQVVKAMLPYLRDCYFNASASIAEFTGVDKPRRDAERAVAQLLNAEEPDCFIFTSGATESNNWVFHSLGHVQRPGRIVISTIEHPSVSEPACELRRRGFDVIEAPVDEQGVIRIEDLSQALTEDTLLVSIMAANNETGVLEPLREIGQLIRDKCPSALFHTDATQAVGKGAVDLQDAWEEVDLLSFSAHKFHGPKGVGGLYIRPGIQVGPMLRGGGQERGLRSGTTNTPALAGLAVAASEVDLTAMEDVRKQRDELETRLIEIFPEVVIYSRNVLRLPNTSTFSLPGLVGEEAAHSLANKGIIVGTGSACSAGALHPPKTVLALGTPYTLAGGTLRVSLSTRTPPLFCDRLITELCRLERSSSL